LECESSCYLLIERLTISLCMSVADEPIVISLRYNSTKTDRHPRELPPVHPGTLRPIRGTPPIRNNNSNSNRNRQEERMRGMKGRMGMRREREDRRVMLGITASEFELELKVVVSGVEARRFADLWSWSGSRLQSLKLPSARGYELALGSNGRSAARPSDFVPSRFAPLART
jgi:hypothetical protein